MKKTIAIAAAGLILAGCGGTTVKDDSASIPVPAETPVYETPTTSLSSNDWDVISEMVWNDMSYSDQQMVCEAYELDIVDYFYDDFAAGFGDPTEAKPAFAALKRHLAGVC